MNAHSQKLISSVNYGSSHRQFELEEKQSDFEAILKLLRSFKHVDKDTAIMEIGTGSGWFEILCKKNGITCKGLEINPERVAHAQQFGRKYGIEPDIELGNIEKTDIGIGKYDIIIANSTFEHVENWKEGLKRVFDGLKLGGLFYFYSTNKFSFVQGEYDFPLYGWLPDSWRYRLRKARQGAEIVHGDIEFDFNQFTYFQLRRAFRDLGFSRVMDRVEFLDPENLNNPRSHKKMIIKILKQVKPLKDLVLLFSSGTWFLCKK